MHLNAGHAPGFKPCFDNLDGVYARLNRRKVEEPGTVAGHHANALIGFVGQRNLGAWHQGIGGIQNCAGDG